MLPMADRPAATSSEPPRLAYIHDANVFGGMETLQLDMLRHLDPSRYRPVVVVPGYDDGPRSSPREFIELLKQAKVPVLKPPRPADMPVVGTLGDLYHTVKLLQRARIDVVHIQTRHPEAARKATVAAWLARVKGVVRTEHLPPSHHLHALARYRIMPFDAMTDFIIADSNSNREEQIRLLGRSPKKVLRSYCGVNALAFNPDHDIAQAKRNIGLNPDMLVVGAIGRLHVQKGHSYLIEAAAQIVRQYGPIQVLLVGDGPLMGELRASVDALGLTPYVHFAGFQAAYIPYMEAMDIGVMPSLWEGFSISMQEFMALGKPMVVTDHPSFLEAFTHEQHGLVVPVRDSAALAASVLRLIRDPALARRLGQAALARVRSEFSIQNHMQDLMAIYDQLLGVPARQRTAQRA